MSLLSASTLVKDAGLVGELANSLETEGLDVLLLMRSSLGERREVLRAMGCSFGQILAINRVLEGYRERLEDGDLVDDENDGNDSNGDDDDDDDDKDAHEDDMGGEQRKICDKERRQKDSECTRLTSSCHGHHRRKEPQSTGLVFVHTEVRPSATVLEERHGPVPVDHGVHHNMRLPKRMVGLKPKQPTSGGRG